MPLIKETILIAVIPFLVLICLALFAISIFKSRGLSKLMKTALILLIFVLLLADVYLFLFIMYFGANS